MAVHVCGKGVAGLVGHYFHIVLGAVKVGKDKGNLIIGDAGAVATAAFAFGGKNIQQFICLLDTSVDEYNTDQITGQAIPYYRYRLDRTIGSLPAMNSTINTQRDSNGEGKYGTEQVQHHTYPRHYLSLIHIYRLSAGSC